MEYILVYFWEFTLDTDLKKKKQQTKAKTSSQSDCRGKAKSSDGGFWQMPPGLSPPNKSQPPSWWLSMQDASLIDNHS